MGKIAVYAGTFDPITNGYLDVIRRATGIFDEVLVAVAHHTEKQTLFSSSERVALAQEAVRNIPGAKVEMFEGMLVKYARRKKVSVLLRGLRAVSDFEAEFQMALLNRKLDSGIETVFLVPQDKYIFISSRSVREIARLGGDLSDLVPRHVKEALKKKFAEIREEGGREK